MGDRSSVEAVAVVKNALQFSGAEKKPPVHAPGAKSNNDKKQNKTKIQLTLLKAFTNTWQNLL